MKWLKILGFAVFSVPQCLTAQKPTTNNNKPTCAMGAICFSGEVTRGQQFHKELNADLEFSLEGEWEINVVPRHPTETCDEFTSAVNAPIQAHNELEIDSSYGWSAEDEIAASPREFAFVTNCVDQQAETKRLWIVLGVKDGTESEQKEAMEKLSSSPMGNGRLWITDSRISHSADTLDDKLGTIEWMRFTVEIRLPAKANPKPSVTH